MKVSKDGEYYCCSHISGPAHNLLRLHPQSTPTEGFAIIVLPPVGGPSPCSRQDIEEIRSSINNGVALASDELGTCYGVMRAEIVANDSWRPQVYVELARRIILAAHGDELS